MFNYSVVSYLHKRNEEFGELLLGLKQKGPRVYNLTAKNHV